MKPFAAGKITCTFAGLIILLSSQLALAAPTPVDPDINSKETKQILSLAQVSKSEVKQYRKIFEAISQNNIKEARKLIRKIDGDATVMGHLLAALYLSKSYPATYTELQNWLKKYNDYPQAARIYKLALRKAPNSAKREEISLPMPDRKFGPYGWDYHDFADKNDNSRNYISQQLRKFSRALSGGKTRAARNIMETAQFKKLLPSQYYSELAAKLAQRYLLDNENKLAKQWADISTRNNKNATAYWISGLAAWRLQQYQNASASFKKLGAMDNDDWLVAAGAYWAARSYNKLKDKNKANYWLKKAAVYRYTFYGILANYKLGNKPDYNWDSLTYYNNLSPSDYISDLFYNPAAKRAIILIFCREYKLAEQEIRRCSEPLSYGQQEALLFLAHKYRAHSLAFYLSGNLMQKNAQACYDYFNYPIPHWQPQSGWKIDQSLILAIARQESAFTPRASSPAGAKGLLQLLPNTAYHITKDISLRRDYQPLFQAEYNLELGQQYVEYLFDKPYINGNIFYMLTAYNAGPGNLYKWQKNVKYNDDPLLFIEVIPARETRIYIERVMANYWIYQFRCNAPTPTLKALAQDHWPYIKD